MPSHRKPDHSVRRQFMPCSDLKIKSFMSKLRNGRGFSSEDLPHNFPLAAVIKCCNEQARRKPTGRV
ncbi:hypothetical protein AAMO2058_000798100 [Amorphochlora amoebiformis]